MSSDNTGQQLPFLPTAPQHPEGNQDSLGDSSEAIMMLAEWMMDDLIALAESFHLDPNDLFREAVEVFVEALKEQHIEPLSEITPPSAV